MQIAQKSGTKHPQSVKWHRSEDDGICMSWMRNRKTQGRQRAIEQADFLDSGECFLEV